MLVRIQRQLTPLLPTSIVSPGCLRAKNLSKEYIFTSIRNKMISTPTSFIVKNLSSNDDGVAKLSQQTSDPDFQANARTSIDSYQRAMLDLNRLQGNTQVLLSTKRNNPETILPRFREHLNLAGIKIDCINALNLIHVSGTKGKGSTCAFTESILRHAGLKTGLLNSPHLLKVTERIQLNGKPIDDKLFTKYFREIYDKLIKATNGNMGEMPGYASFLTLLSFFIFIEEQVDCAIIEVGLGGEYDQTNVIGKPVVCGITTLDYDHTHVLGNTIESIAWNKAGIIKPNVPVFTVEHDSVEALKVIENRAREKGSPLHVCPVIRWNSLDLGIKSSAQYVNATLACHLADCLLKKLSKKDLSVNGDFNNLPRHFRNGLEMRRWPGRCQTVEFSDNICFFIDGAHTRKSMENCLEWFKIASSMKDANAQQVLMVNVVGDRDRAMVLGPLVNHDSFTHVIFSTNQPDIEGGIDNSDNFNLLAPKGEKILENARNNAKVWMHLTNDSSEKIIITPSTTNAIKAVESLVDKDRNCHVLVTGSLYFAGAVLDAMMRVNDKINIYDTSC